MANKPVVIVLGEAALAALPGVPGVAEILPGLHQAAKKTVVRATARCCGGKSRAAAVGRRARATAVGLYLANTGAAQKERLRELFKAAAIEFVVHVADGRRRVRV